VGPHVEDGEDVGVVQGGDGLGLTLEATEAVGIGRDLGTEDLEGHLPLQAGIPGAVDLPHSSRPEGLEDLVGAEACSGGNRHWGTLPGSPSLGGSLHRLAQGRQEGRRGSGAQGPVHGVERQLSGLRRQLVATPPSWLVVLLGS
jgi:hypothetical protein